MNLPIQSFGVVRLILWGSALLSASGIFVPYFVVGVFSVSHGLPFFEVIGSLGDNMKVLGATAVLFTFLVVGFFMLPGFLEITETSALTKKPSDGISDRIQKSLDSYRWSLSFGSALIVLSALAWKHVADNDAGDLVFIGMAIALSMVSARVIRDFFLPRDARNSLGLKKHPIFSLDKDSVPKLFFSNIVGFMYVLMFIAASTKIIRALKLDLDLLRYESSYRLAADLATGFVVGGGGVVLFMAASTWTARRSLKVALYTVLAAFFLLLVIWPRGNVLVGLYLNLFAQGGGKYAVLTVDKEIIERWRDLAPWPPNTEPEGVTTTLKLALLGTQYVFVFLPPQNIVTGAIDEDILMIPRSKVREIRLLTSGIDHSSRSSE